MINSKELNKNIRDLFAETEEEEFVAGNGIQTNVRIGFNLAKLNEKKQEIAILLRELGVDEHVLIRLSSLTKYKNGETWNNLQSIEDYQTLELLLACADACGFIHNDFATIQRNIAEIGEFNSIVISKFGRILMNDEDWLKAIRESIVNNMYFLTDPEKIRAYANGTYLEEEAPKFGGK